MLASLRLQHNGQGGVPVAEIGYADPPVRQAILQRADAAALQEAFARQPTHRPMRDAAADLAARLTQYTDANGNVAAARSAVFRFGPYLKSTPPIYPGPAGVALLWKKSLSSAKWVYDEATGDVRMK